MEKETNSQTSSEPSYEVFLSFRGPDTRYGFADCLYHGMVAAGILVFRDDESLRVGERIGGELLQAIEKSKIYIPIFSTNYALSHWCLRELAYMVECASKSNENKEILPIFFDVEPEDVKLKTNLYRQTLSKRQKTFCSTEVESWEKALTEVGKIKGWNLKKDEGQGDLIQSVIQAVLVKLNVRYKNVTEDLIGVDDRVEAIIKMLDVESDGVRFLTIHGMGGVGKTTLAKVVFNRLSSLFQSCNFLSDVRESSERHNLVYLQKQLLSKFLDSRSIDQIHEADDGINMIKRVLCNKKVLIVLDDVDEKRQLRSLAEKGNWFGSGSRIIITTRYKSVLMIEGEATSEGSVKSANVLTYEVQEMEFHHALKLFSRHAFRRDSPPDHYVPLSEKVVFTLGKLPLALEVTGSSLSGKSEKFWVDTLKKLEKAPSIEVQKTLMITYERLDYAQRQVFLDMACFFVNEDKTYPFYMWDDCEYCPHNAIEVLCLMSLIKIKDDNTIWMHDQVRDLGRAIIHEENFKDPCERSRVWNHQEALSILKQKEGSRKIEALSLGYRGDIVMHDEVANLRNLRFLEANGVFLIGDFNNLFSNLRWLSWRWCPYEFVAANFHLTNLVILDLSHSYVSEKWIGWNQIKVASKLKVLDLTNCNYLRRTPDISTLVSLERLILEGCRNLIEIDPSIGKLKLLTTLNLNGCKSLVVLPEEIGCLEALTKILMPCSPCGFKLPETFGNLRSLLSFDVSHRQISKLPYSIGGLVKLGRLNLSGCTKIKELPDSVWKLQSLFELDLSLTSLGHLSDSIGNLKQLKVLRMSRVSGITKLPSAIGLLDKLEELDVSGCQNLTDEIPEEIGRLSCLSILDLSRTYISKLPDSISNLKELKVLRMSHIIGITKLPSTIGLLEKLEELDASGCHNLTCKIPKEIGRLFCLSILNLSHTRISTLPDSIGNLKQLKVLRVNPISGTTKLPSAIGLVEKLEILDVSGCRNLARKILEEIGRLSYLSILDLSRTRISTLPDSIGNLKQLKVLRMSHISGIKKLPSAIGLLEKLEELDASGCPNLTGKIPEEIGRLSCLSILNLSYTHISGIPTTVSRLSNLQILNLESCPKLKQLSELPPSLTCLRCAPDSFRYFYELMQFDGESSTALSTSIYPPPGSYIPIQSVNPTLSPRAKIRILSSLSAGPARGNLVNAELSDFSISINLWTSRLDSSSMSDFAGTFCVELKVLQLHRCKLGKPDALFQLEMDSLRHLEMYWCKFLPEVLDLSHMKNLQEVHLLGCESVEIRGLEELGFLGYLLVMDCRSMERMSDLSKLRKLRKLRVGNCNMLRSVEGLNHLESLQKLWIHDCRSLESLADTSNLDLECSQVVRCGWMPDRRNCCKRGRAYCHCMGL